VIVVGACASSGTGAPKSTTTASSVGAMTSTPMGSTSTSSSASASTSPSTSTSTFVVAEMPSAAATVFAKGKTVSFTPGGGSPKQASIAKHTHFSGISRDLQSFVTGYDKQGVLVTAAAPKGIAWAAHSPQNDGARFAPNGARVAVMQYLGPLVVMSTSDAKTIWTRGDGDGAGECEVRWTSDDRLTFHAMSKETTARLWSVDLASGTATPTGPAIGVDACTASPDGKRWLLFVDYESGKATSAIRVRDAASGVVTELVRNVASTWVLSPTADRACWLDRAGKRLLCRRTNDLAVEEILSGVEVQGLEIDDAGARMLIGSATLPDEGDESDEPRAVMYLADFAAGTIRKLDAVTNSTGGTMHPLSGGHLIAAGSAGGVDVWDVDAGKRWRIKRNAAFTVHPIPGESRRFVLGAEVDSSMEDLFLVTVP
jgi:hypothetical protein